MRKILATLGIIVLGGGSALGADVAQFNETAIDMRADIANERVEAIQTGNKVKTDFTWKGEQGFSLAYDMGEPTAKERALDRRDKQVIVEQVDFGDGGFKVDIILNQKLDTNRFCYDIENHQNYDFFYQPELTPEEIAEGANRPEDIVGSYAVYHKTLKNNEYRTGKVMHIPRPQVWEVDDKENTIQWAQLDYSPGELCVTVDQDYLDTANYPVRVDPTFGYTSIGGSASTIAGANDIIGSKGTVSGTGMSVDSIHIYSGSNNTGDLKGIAVLASALTILSDGVTPATSAVGGDWTQCDYVTKPTVSDATDYYAAFIGSDTSFSYYYDSGGTNNRLSDSSNSYASPTDPTDATLSNFTPSIYATYTADAGETQTTVNTIYEGDLEVSGDTILH